ncbi:TetR/AcrR family transcriptional regulator [Mycobacterium sp.]|uniref:TetR/AcrR family transcriptional regulator n=1 Tax=Mycobacterium sp. TaxID=1785 RepID=UPI003C771B46
MTERWTRERRLQHTRNLLLDGAEELVARKGLGSASLGDIADAAGYTRGAIYSHFGSKEELLLAVIERHRQRFLDGFADLMSSLQRFDDLNLDELAARWRELSNTDAERTAILEYEFTLFLLRNPEARKRVAAQRLETVRWLSDYITSSAARMGATLRMPAADLARVILATNGGVTLYSLVDDADLYRPFLELVTSGINSSFDSD